MSAEPMALSDPQLQRALVGIQDLIRAHYPAATFRVTQGEDPEGVYLKATVDVEDLDEVVDTFIDRLLEAQIDEGLPLYVVPLRPLERNAQLLRDRALARP